VSVSLHKGALTAFCPSKPTQRIFNDYRRLMGQKKKEVRSDAGQVGLNVCSTLSCQWIESEKESSLSCITAPIDSLWWCMKKCYPRCAWLGRRTKSMTAASHNFLLSRTFVKNLAGCGTGQIFFVSLVSDTYMYACAHKI
jgi:hypothetical protein